MQWIGNVTTVAIEQGPGWMNIQTSAVNINPSIIFFAPLQTLIVGAGLKSQAVDAAEKQLFARINITVAYNPLGIADPDGFNSGNELIGLPAL